MRGPREEGQDGRDVFLCTSDQRVSPAVSTRVTCWPPRSICPMHGLAGPTAPSPGPVCCCPLSKGSCSSTSQQSSARGEAVPLFTSQPCVAHHDRDVPAEQGRCAPSQQSLAEDLAAYMLPSSTHRPCCPGSLQHCQRVPPPCSHWGGGLTELLHLHPTTASAGAKPPRIHGVQMALPTARNRTVPCRAGRAPGSPTNMPPPSTLTISCSPGMALCFPAAAAAGQGRLWCSAPPTSMSHTKQSLGRPAASRSARWHVWLFTCLADSCTQRAPNTGTGLAQGACRPSRSSPQAA